MQSSGSSGRTPRRFSQARIGLVLLSLATMLAPAAVGAEADPDPWEGPNRKIWAFNDKADKAILRPIAKGYEWLFPEFIRSRIHNVFQNIGTPSVAANQLLQGKPGAALGDTMRFFINSTMGIGGIFDVAMDAGLPHHEEDFGQTLVVWGVPNGPFISIPFRGPATTTHAVGMVVETFANPYNLISPKRDRYIIYGTSFVDLRAELLAAEVLITGDEYLFLRDAYLQRREFLILDGEIEDDPFADDFDDYEE